MVLVRTPSMSNMIASTLCAFILQPRGLDRWANGALIVACRCTLQGFITVASGSIF